MATKDEASRVAHVGSLPQATENTSGGLKAGLSRYAFVLPVVVLLLLLTIWPLLYSVWASFQNYNLQAQNQITFYGIKNYSQLLLHNDVFWTSMRITVEYTVIVVCVELILGLLIAMLLDRSMRGISIFRTLIMVPILIAPVLVGLTWRFMYEPEIGVINYVLHFFGVPSIKWVSDIYSALPSVMIVDIWQWTPFVVLVLLAGLQAIPREVVEASALDGLTTRQYFFKVLWPTIRPVVLVVVLIRMMDSMKVFDSIYVMTAGGPGSATFLATIYDYVIFFTQYDVGSASAMSYFVLILINVFAVGLIFFLGKEEKQASTGN